MKGKVVAEFRTFKNVLTGKTGQYPAHFASRPNFVEIDPETAECITCGKHAAEVEDEPEAEVEFINAALEPIRYEEVLEPDIDYELDDDLLDTEDESL